MEVSKGGPRCFDIDEDLTLRRLSSTLYTMILLRPVAIIVGLAMLLINSGDCVNLAFADAKAADCCLHGDCPFAAATQMDSCCSTSPSPAKYIQGPVQSPLLQPAVQDVEFPTEFLSVAQAGDSVAHVPSHWEIHSPPGRSSGLSTPLLI